MTSITAEPKRRRRRRANQSGPGKRSRRAESPEALSPEVLFVPTAERTEKPAEKSDTEIAAKPGLFPDGINWAVLGWLVVLHGGALAAPFFFSWSGLAIMFVLHWITGGIGICLGFHRLLTHRSFTTWRPVKWLLAAVGGLAGEGPAIYWVADHRKHHAHSDHEGDPHSPHDGPWWSHVLWIVGHHSRPATAEHVKRWAPDLLRDRSMVWLNWLFLPLHIVLGGMLFAAGWWAGGPMLAVSWLLFGLFARVVFVLHSTWLVNSASHMWGYVNYRTKDDSKNNWVVALFSYGEGWHNNHHAYPRLARHGHRWWEIDLTFMAIRVMQRLGLAWDVADRRPPLDGDHVPSAMSDSSPAASATSASPSLAGCATKR